jgi:LemA protein
MSLLRRTGLLAPLAAFSLAGCGLNSVPTAEENVNAKWANVQNQYQRRSDLYGNLVETVRAAANQERTVLREVTEARSRANSVQLTPDQLSDPQAIQRYADAQARLSAPLVFRQLQEAYPQLQTNANFRDLQAQIEGTENRISIAREDYNQAVQQYNTTIRTFPDAIGARLIHGAKPKVPFQAITPGAEVAPKVDFNLQ